MSIPTTDQNGAEKEQLLADAMEFIRLLRPHFGYVFSTIISPKLTQQATDLLERATALKVDSGEVLDVDKG